MDVSRERSFWYEYMSLAFGQRGPAFAPEVLSECFGIDDGAAHKWWSKFTGWYESVLEEADGHVDNPGVLEIPVEGGNALIVEAHPGDVYIHRRLANEQAQDTIANFGPHWWIPEWSLGGARRLSGTNPFALLVLSPLVRLDRDDERSEAEGLFSEAWVQAGILYQAAAVRLATKWSRCAVGGK